MVQKSENQSQKNQWTQQIRKRPKKAKIKGQKLRFRSVDNNKLTKNRTKKAKLRARKVVDTKRPKKAKIKGQNYDLAVQKIYKIINSQKQAQKCKFIA